EGFKIPEYGGRGRDRTMMLLPPASFLRPSLLTGESLCFYPAEHSGETCILLEDPDVVNGVPSREVEQYQREDHLLVRPPLGLPYVHMGTDVISQTEDGGEVEVDGKAGKGGHSRAGFLFFILVGQDALCHNSCTSLVIGLVAQPYSIIPVYQGQRGFSLFLTVNQGLESILEFRYWDLGFDLETRRAPDTYGLLV